MGDPQRANRRFTGYGPIRLPCDVLTVFRTVVASFLSLLAPVMTVFVVASFVAGFCGACFAPFGPCVVHDDGYVPSCSFAFRNAASVTSIQNSTAAVGLCDSACRHRALRFVVSVLRFVFSSSSSSRGRREDDLAVPPIWGCGQGNPTRLLSVSTTRWVLLVSLPWVSSVTPPKAVTDYLSKSVDRSVYMYQIPGVQFPGVQILDRSGVQIIGPVRSPNFWTGQSPVSSLPVLVLLPRRFGGGGGDVAARALWMKISAWVRCSPSFEPALLPWPSSPCGGGQSWPDSLVFPQPAPVVLTGRPVKSSLPRATARFCTNQPLRGGPRNGTCPEKGGGFPARLQSSASAQSSSPWFSLYWRFSGVPSSAAPLCSDPGADLAVCSTAPAGPLGAGDQSPPRVVSWFGFLDVSLLFHSVSLSLTASGFVRRPRVKGFHGTELLAGPWLCDPSAVRDLREVAASGRSQQWSVPQWVLSVLCAQCALVFSVAVSPYAPAMGVVAVDLGFSAMGLVLSAASLMVGAIASVPGLMVGAISSVRPLATCGLMTGCLLPLGMDCPPGILGVGSQ